MILSALPWLPGEKYFCKMYFLTFVLLVKKISNTEMPKHFTCGAVGRISCIFPPGHHSETLDTSLSLSYTDL